MAATELASPAAAPTVAASGRASRGADLLLLALAAVVLWACFSSGATRPPAETHIQVAFVVVAILAGVAIAAGSLRMRTTRLGAAGALGLLAFAGWSGLSLGWTITPEETWLLTNRALTYAIVLGLGIVVGSSDPRALARAPVALLGTVSVVALYAFGTKALPGFHVGGLIDLNDSGFVARLRAPLGYWNAVGILLALGTPVGLRLATQAERRLRERALGLAATFLLVCTIGLTYSRGALIALAVALLVLTLFGRGRLRAIVLAVGVGVASVPVLAVAYSRNGVAGNGVALSVRSHDGRTLLLVFVFCLAGLLAGLLAFTRLEARVRWSARQTREVFRGAVILASLVVLAGTVGLAVSEKGIPRTVHDRVQDITQPGSGNALDPGRLVSSNSGNRWQWWREAAGAWSDRPLAGWGAGSFRALHLRYREDETPVTEAHSTPMQFLSETGIVGLVLGLGGIGLLLAAATARVRGSTGAERELGVAGLAAVAAWAVHGFYDWDWDFPAVMYPALATLGVLVGRPEPRPGGAEPAAGRVLALGLACLALAAVAVSAILPAWAAGKASDAQAALSADTVSDARLVDAAAQAARAARLDPLAIEPLEASAAIAQRRGRLLDARRFDVEAVERQPDSAEAWNELAETAFQLADREGFVRAALRALALDPHAPAARQLALLAIGSRTPGALSATAGGTPLAPG